MDVYILFNKEGSCSIQVHGEMHCIYLHSHVEQANISGQVDVFDTKRIAVGISVPILDCTVRN
jgi:hypothetical protein